MGAAGAMRAGDVPVRGAAERSLHSGRIVVHPRVLEKVTQEVAANALQVERGSVSVEVSEGSRGIAVRLTAPLPVPDLDDTDAIRSGPSVVERVARIQEQTRDRVSALVGRDVTRVDVAITGALIAQKRRVK